MTLNNDQKQAILWWIQLGEEEAYRVVEHVKEKERINAYNKGSYVHVKKCYDVGLELKKKLIDSKH